MTLFLESNIWVWKCLFVLESKYKHRAYTLMHSPAHRQLCASMCMYYLLLLILCTFTPVDEQFLHSHVLSVPSKRDCYVYVRYTETHQDFLNSNCIRIETFSVLFLVLSSSIFTMGESIVQDQLVVFSWSLTSKSQKYTDNSTTLKQQSFASNTWGDQDNVQNVYREGCAHKEVWRQAGLECTV